ncbi:DUF3397 domain-containing protein [Oceanobacillus salinisoli]|uniref:DUF3397 domain-containing protein n=1 Tax=Oceanobacillus salinisoli TaxID=2678611 RepID=UPI0018CC5A9E|nr:DUF3397 domain-containing protein [Oceanobacillus salinisoli]
MVDFIVYFLAFFITIPAIASVIVYIISLKIFHSTKRAVHTSVNWTTLLYIIAVNLLIQNLFHMSTTGFILLFMLIVLTLTILYQWRNHMDIEFKKAFRILWRISFLLFMFSYVCLVITGIIMQIIG